MFSYKPMFLTIDGSSNDFSSMSMVIGYSNACDLLNNLKEHFYDVPLRYHQGIKPQGYAAQYNYLVYEGFRCLCETPEQALFIGNINCTMIQLHLLNKHNKHRSVCIMPKNYILKLSNSIRKLEKILTGFQGYYDDFITATDYTLVDRSSEQYKHNMRAEYISRIPIRYTPDVQKRDVTHRYVQLIENGVIDPLWFDNVA